MTEKKAVDCECGATAKKPLMITDSRSYWLQPVLFNGAKVEYELKGQMLRGYEGHHTRAKKHVSMFWRLVGGTSWVYNEHEALV